MRRILRGCPDDETVPCDDAHRKHPEVLTVVSQLGRPDDGTDVSGFYNIEFFAPLEPFDEWPRGLTKDKLTDADQRRAPRGVPGRHLQLLAVHQRQRRGGRQRREGRELGQGVRPDLEANEKIADGDRRRHGRRCRGSRTSGISSSLGQPNIKITPDRAACARYGLNTGDVDAVIQAAIGGQAVTQVYEGEKFFDLTVRWKPSTA